MNYNPFFFKVGIGKVEKNYGKLEYKPYTMSFKCKICNKRFKEEFCLDKHMEVLHPDPSKKKPPASTVVTTSPQTVHYVQKNIAQVGLLFANALLNFIYSINPESLVKNIKNR